MTTLVNNELNDTSPTVDVDIDYKNLDLIKRSISARGKILPRRLTMLSAKKQRVLAKAVKRARFLALIAAVNL